MNESEERNGRSEEWGIYYPLVPYRFVWSSARLLPVSRHRLTVSLVGRREGTGLLTSLPSLCFGPSVHASGRQGQGPARFLVPLVNRGPVARRASSVGTAHSVHSPAPGGGRNERSEERAVILPSHHGPSPSLPAEPGQGSDRLSLISSVPSLRRVTSYPRPLSTSLLVHRPPLVTLRLTSSTSLVSSGGRREDTTDGRRRETSGERNGTVGERLTNERSEWRKIRVTVPSLSPVPFVPSSFGPSRPRSFLTSVARFLTSSGTTGRSEGGKEPRTGEWRVVTLCNQYSLTIRRARGEWGR